MRLRRVALWLTMLAGVALPSLGDVVTQRVERVFTIEGSGSHYVNLGLPSDATVESVTLSGATTDNLQVGPNSDGSGGTNIAVDCGCGAYMRDGRPFTASGANLANANGEMYLVLDNACHSSGDSRVVVTVAIIFSAPYNAPPRSGGDSPATFNNGCDSAEYNQSDDHLFVIVVALNNPLGYGPGLGLTTMVSSDPADEASGRFGRNVVCEYDTELKLAAADPAMRLPNGYWATPSKIAGTDDYKLPVHLDGSLAKTNGLYRFVQQDGTVYQYIPENGTSTTHYVLDRMWDARSNTIEVVRSNSVVAMIRQVGVTNARYIAFAYDASGRVARATTDQWTARAALFSYSTNGTLTNIVTGSGQSKDLGYTTNATIQWLKPPSASVPSLKFDYLQDPPDLHPTNSVAATRETTLVCSNAAGSIVSNRALLMSWITDTHTVCGIDDPPIPGYSDRGRSGQFGGGHAESVGVAYKGAGSGSSLFNTHDSIGRVTTVKDENGLPTSYGYNTNNRVIRMTNAEGRVWQFFYTNGIDLVRVQTPEGRVPFGATYNAYHEIVSVSNALGATVNFQYDGRGLVTNRSDGRVSFAYQYDGAGKLLTVKRNGALLLTQTVDGRGQVVAQTDVAGLTLTNTYDDASRLLTARINNAALVSSITNVYDCCDLQSHTDRRGQTWHYTHDKGRITSMTDPRGLVTTYAYNGQSTNEPTANFNRPTFITNEFTQLRLSYDVHGRLAQITLPAREDDPGEHTAYIRRDHGGQVQYAIGFAGERYAVSNDVMKRLKYFGIPDGKDYASYSGSQTGIVLSTTVVSRDDDGLPTAVKDIRGTQVTLQYNAAFMPTNRIYPDSTSESWSYNPWGDLVGVKDRADRATGYGYDSLGRLTSVTNPAGRVVRYGYDAADRVTSILHQDTGYTWAFGYDAEGNVTDFSSPNGLSANLSYDPSGLATQALVEGIVVGYDYDPMGALTSVRVDGHVVVSNVYDKLGRLQWQQDASGVVISNRYDSWGDLVRREWPQASLVESFQYGVRGLTNAIDRLGIASSYLLDTLGRTTHATDGATNTVTMSERVDGQQADLYDANSNHTGWVWNEATRTETKTFADSSQETRLYDVLGRLVSWQRPFPAAYGGSVTITNDYEPGGRLASIDPKDQMPIALTYDSLGRLTNMTDGSGSTAWRYTQVNRVVEETGPHGAGPVTARYDALGRLTNLIFAGNAWTYSYDSLGRAQSLVAPEGSYSFGWLQNGRHRTQTTYPNGVTETRQHDVVARLTNIAWSTSSVPVRSVSYAYDANNRRTAEVWSTSRTIAYAYDAAGRLTNAQGNRAGDDASWTYDKAGNIVGRERLGIAATATGANNLNQVGEYTAAGSGLTVLGSLPYNGTATVNGVTATLYADKPAWLYEAVGVGVSAGSNLLTLAYTSAPIGSTTLALSTQRTVNVGDRTEAHDERGRRSIRLTGAAESLFSDFDNLDRLTNVAVGASTVSIQYDGMGRRTQVTRDGVTEKYVYWPRSFLLLAVLDATNGVKQFFTRGPDLSGGMQGAGGIGGLLAQRDWNANGTWRTHYLHADANGNVVLATAADGRIAAGYQYGAYGDLLWQSGSFLSRHLFSSKDYDPVTGLYWYGFRYYDPGSSRWITRDPLGEAGGINLYAFVNGDPLGNVDPWGLQERGCASRPKSILQDLDSDDHFFAENIQKQANASADIGKVTHLAQSVLEQLPPVALSTALTGEHAAAIPGDPTLTTGERIMAGAAVVPPSWWGRLFGALARVASAAGGRARSVFMRGGDAVSVTEEVLIIKAPRVSPTDSSVARSSCAVECTEAATWPAGLTKESFEEMSTLLRRRLKETAQYGDLGDDIFVQGGRAAGKTSGDIDLGIRVSAEKFNELIQARLKTLTPGSDTWKTLMVAKERGRIHAGEIGISGVRKEMQRLLGIDTDLSVILRGGPFDNPPFIPVN